MPTLGALALYVLFAWAVFILQGPAPDVNIDHISYFKLADEIRAQHRDGAYWRQFSSVASYGVMLAYLYDVTGSHVLSLKLLLAGMTVAYLFAFQIFMSMATKSRSQAVLFSIMSAFFVSFGASFWGVTDFSASLNRTLILPFVVIMVWMFLRYYDSPWRYAAFPLLVLFSLLHLSTYYVILVLVTLEGLDFLLLRRCRIDRRVAFFVLALIVAVGVRETIEYFGIGFTRFVEATVKAAIPTQATIVADKILTSPPPSNVLTPHEAWYIELYAFPWRNLPPPLTTLANFALSFGVIFALAVYGAVTVFRSHAANRLDRLMLLFAAAILMVAYGLQLLMLALRNLVPIYPINFEEVRSINLLMMPAVYFVFRLYESRRGTDRVPASALRLAIVAAFVLQPIVIIRLLPHQWREDLVTWAADTGMLKRGDTLRLLYARQYLGLATGGPRFYYSAQPAVEWLRKHTGPSDAILTDRNEFHLAGLNAVGPFLGMVQLMVTDPARRTWKERADVVNQALVSADTGQVVEAARRYGATFAVVPWPVNGAAYRDEYFSVIRVQ